MREESLELKKLGDGWHFRIPRVLHGNSQILGHMHGTVSYPLIGSFCLHCGDEPPESVKMLVKLQKLKECL